MQPARAEPGARETYSFINKRISDIVREDERLKFDSVGHHLLETSANRYRVSSGIMNKDLHITVAAVVERGGRFLLVEERIDGSLKINQPAGHLEPGENLYQAVIREAREETACAFQPEALLGVYLWRARNSGPTFLRAAFCGSVGEADPGRVFDSGIEQTLWLSRDDILSREAQWRSPLVLRCIDDYLAGRRFPIDILVDMLPNA